MAADGCADASPQTRGLKPANHEFKHWPALLVLEDDEAIRWSLTHHFEKRGFQMGAAANVSEAKLLFQRRETWTMVLSDYHLPDGTGWEFCRWVREQPGATPLFLLMSGGLAKESLSGVEFLAKPFALATLETRMRALLQSREPEPRCVVGRCLLGG